MKSTINRQTTIDRSSFEQAAIDQLTISSEHRIVSKERTTIMINLFRISGDENSNNYHSLKCLLAQCEFVEKSAQSDVIQWIQYKDHLCLFIFAYHATLLTLIITKYSLDAIQLCYNILSLIIKHYYHTTNDNDEYILICLQELSNRELIIAAVDIALIKCRSSRRSKAILGNFLERMNGDFIRLYHVLMFIVVDS
ncbi:unnamed protein product [Rotaria sp. Silwood2]|nr:unnamed protein product [Rotaria sp. Silwood2]CAF4569222.1 unnamed protein product [Rotaria sp. Silwood2]